jgi:O-antigen/teichoic acid export membrane protein
LDKLNKLFRVKDNKSKTVIRNVFFSFFIKALNISVNFLTIPLVLTFLNTTQYGVWLTLTAVLGWFSLFDLGFGNGLRNHLTVAIANQDYKEGKIYVSTTYAALSVIFGLLILVFVCVHPFINWVAVFNAPASMGRDINYAVLFAMCFLFVQFIVRLINTVLLSFQRAAMADFTNALVQVFILIGLYILKISHLNSLTAVAIVYSLTPVIIFLTVSLVLFFNTFNNISPSIYFIKTSYVNKLLKLGISFFVIQIAALVVYASDNFIITQLFEPSEVTIYNIALVAYFLP